MSNVTSILSAIKDGDPKAAEELLPLVYEELRKLAALKMARESPDHTLQATALVHEAYVRLVGPDGNQCWENRGHFFSAAAEAMRRILVDRARRKKCVRHGGDHNRIELNQDISMAETPPDQLLAIDESLDRLAAESPIRAELVKLRFFAGMTIPEAAETLSISRATAERYWTYARCWLYADISDGGEYQIV